MYIDVTKNKEFSDVICTMTFNGVTDTIKNLYDRARRAEDGSYANQRAGRPVHHLEIEGVKISLSHREELYHTLWYQYLYYHSEILTAIKNAEGFHDERDEKSIISQKRLFELIKAEGLEPLKKDAFALRHVIDLAKEDLKKAANKEMDVTPKDDPPYKKEELKEATGNEKCIEELNLDTTDDFDAVDKAVFRYAKACFNAKLDKETMKKYIHAPLNIEMTVKRLAELYYDNLTGDITPQYGKQLYRSLADKFKEATKAVA